MPDPIVEGLIVSQPDVTAPEPRTEITVSPKLTVKLTRRKTNTSQTILVTVNKDSKVTINGVVQP